VGRTYLIWGVGRGGVKDLGLNFFATVYVNSTFRQPLGQGYVGLDALCTIIPIIRVLSEKLTENLGKDLGDAHPLDSAYMATCTG
jgi:hypothetical protein